VAEKRSEQFDRCLKKNKAGNVLCRRCGGGSIDGIGTSEIEAIGATAGVIARDSKKYAAAGGWGFQSWARGDPKNPFVTDAAKQCFE
jgi:hypothetical protein